MLLPLDERPINARFPRLLAGVLGWRLEVPEALLGSRKRPGDADAIVGWMRDTAPRAIGAVVALDTLAWGGLIPSRQSGNDLDGARVSLDALRSLRRAHPRLPIMAFSSIQRVSREDDDGEEPAYHRTYGRRIFRRSVLEHRAADDALGDGEGDELARLRTEIPEGVWGDVVAIRARTRAINLAALDLVAEGVVDALVLNQDDTTTWGLNVQDRALLEAEVRRRGLGSRVFVYPGADEVAQVLMARLAARVHRRQPRFAALFSARRGTEVQTAYEDRPLGDLVAVHLRAAGAVLAPTGMAPDAWLAVNAPSRAQGQGGTAFALRHDAHGLLGEETRGWLEASEAAVRGLDRSLEGFADAIAALVDDDARVSVADVAHVNGADDDLMAVLEDAGLLPRLAGYGGWNTAGNALGSAVALGCLAILAGTDGERAEALERAVATRYADDWLYQARVRARLLLEPELHPLGLGGFVPPDDLPRVERLAHGWLADEMAARGWPFRLGRLALPWQRVFEIDLELTRSPGAAPWGGP
jgi:hypothetical protein